MTISKEVVNMTNMMKEKTNATEEMSSTQLKELAENTTILMKNGKVWLFRQTTKENIASSQISH